MSNIKTGRTIKNTASCTVVSKTALAAICAVALFLLSSCSVQAVPMPLQSASPSAAAVSPAAPIAETTPAPTVIPAPADQSPSPSPTATATPAHLEAVCIKAANLYAHPGTGVVGRLKPGENVEIVADTGGWMQISVLGISGYVRRENVITKSTPVSPVPEGDWAKILVNPSHPLPTGFEVILADFGGGKVDARILGVCRDMFADAEKDGAPLVLVDAYRNRERQKALFEEKVQNYLAKGYSRSDAERQAATITARPDTSEHQTGLAMDVVTSSYGSRNSGFADTRAFAWLSANAQNYGFILRYGQEKKQFTGVIYEPWHWRFVGVQAAKEIKNTGQCLEEYMYESE